MAIQYGTTPHRPPARCFAALLVIIVSMAAANEARAQIRPVDLGTLGGPNSWAVAVNTSGQVVGTSEMAYRDGPTHAFLWTAAGGMIDLGTLGSDFSDAYSEAIGINAAGQVVGNSQVESGNLVVVHPFLWTAKRGMIDLGTLAALAVTSSYATAVNASGQVVGWSFTPTDETHAFSWTATGGMIDLGTLGGDRSGATSVNASGQVVGWSETGTGETHAFSWTAVGGMIDLGTLGGAYPSSAATSVNASGQVVGSSYLGATHAFSWTAAGGMIDLGTLGSPGTSEATAVNASGQVVGNSNGRAFSWTLAGGMINLGTLSGAATAVNASGQVVGSSFMPTTFEVHAFSWTAAGGMIDLRTLGGDVSFAAAVNARGLVVGSARTTSANIVHAVLWPVIFQTLPPTADTYVRAGAYAAQNFGSAGTLLAKSSASVHNTRRTYLKFDVSHITDDQRVTLRLHGSASSETGPIKSTVYAVSDTSWGERAVTWNTRPALGAVLGSVTVDGTSAQWVELDVTKYVRAQRRAGRSIISLALRNVAQTNAYAAFQSREAGNTGPRLVITPF